MTVGLAALAALLAGLTIGLGLRFDRVDARLDRIDKHISQIEMCSGTRLGYDVTLVPPECIKEAK